MVKQPPDHPLLSLSLACTCRTSRKMAPSVGVVLLQPSHFSEPACYQHLCSACIYIYIYSHGLWSAHIFLMLVLLAHLYCISLELWHWVACSTHNLFLLLSSSNFFQVRVSWWFCVRYSIYWNNLRNEVKRIKVCVLPVSCCFIYLCHQIEMSSSPSLSEIRRVKLML